MVTFSNKNLNSPRFTEWPFSFLVHFFLFLLSHDLFLSNVKLKNIIDDFYFEYRKA